MWLIAIGVVAGLTAVLFADFCLCWGYVRAFQSHQLKPSERPGKGGSELPRLTIIMPLRGGDPYLRQAILSIINNDYPRLSLRIVIDHPDDEAHSIVAETVRETAANNVHVSYLNDRSPERSLFCSSVLQAFDQAESESDLIAICAADMIVPANWFWDMAQAMSDPEVGTPLGNRWYMPETERLGSLVRHVWNVGAVLVMWRLQIPWSGAVALRPSDVRRTNLWEKWRRSLSDDQPIADAVRQMGLKLRFVPSLIIVNREEIGLRGGFEFIKRQMLMARLYHSRWPFVLVLALACLVVPMVPLVLGAWTLATGEWAAAALLIGSLIAYFLGLALIVEIVESVIRQMLLARGEKVPPRSLRYFAYLAVALPLTMVLYPLAAMACCFTRKIVWRGIRYRIHPGCRIEMEEYKPFARSQRREGANISI